MTWSKFHKNCIITGHLDGYCLVCENHMKNEDEYKTHIDKPIHKKNIDATPYFEKYKNELVRKVKKGYYCEACNTLFSTTHKVSLHIAETQHRYNKGIHLLRRNDSKVIAYGNVLICDDAWNGLVDETCVICNTEFENVLIHKTSQDHILNLIQKNVEFAEEESVYRKIDESSFQCLTCNFVLALDTFASHFQDENHKKELKQRRVENTTTSNEINNKPVKKTSEVTIVTQKKNTNEKTAESVKVPEKPVETAKNESNKKRNKTEEIFNKNKDIIKNALEMDKYICEVLRAKNYVAPNQEANNVMCLLCDWSMDPENVPSHINGRHHLTMLKMHKERLQKLSETEKVPVEDKKVKDSPYDDDISKVLDSLQEFQKNDINVNFEMNAANCKKCSMSFKLQYDVLKRHIEEHKKKVNKKETKQVPLPSGNEVKTQNGNTSLYTKPVLFKEKEERPSRTNSTARDDQQILSYAKENNLIYKNGKVTCEVCDSRLSASMKCLKQHVASHKSNNKSTALAVTSYKSANLQKVPMSEFVKSIVGVKDFLLNNIVINEKFNISMLSFLMITAQNNVLKCLPCEDELDLQEAEVHKLTDRHRKAMAETMVVVSLENEFIREPRHGIYHCGFCSEVALGWEGLVDHIATSSHRESRNHASWRLQEHAGDIAKAKWEQEVERNLMAFMFQRFSNNRDSSDDEW